MISTDLVAGVCVVVGPAACNVLLLRVAVLIAAGLLLTAVKRRRHGRRCHVNDAPRVFRHGLATWWLSLPVRSQSCRATARRGGGGGGGFRSLRPRE